MAKERASSWVILSRFGNLVTMKWWDDLWLNEAFANMISWMCMEEAKGLEDITLAWYNFMS
jgi:aminopeptidase N